ncbi:hypothetical protein [Agromyces allii]|uniref:hypothetical protein n=1 Tax=Agromyces allii TaxID=393607 RepID=UPI0012FAE10A|nr:hypothetical protein [Agromyces allii]
MIWRGRTGAGVAVAVAVAGTGSGAAPTDAVAQPASSAITQAAVTAAVATGRIFVERRARPVP